MAGARVAVDCAAPAAAFPSVELRIVSHAHWEQWRWLVDPSALAALASGCLHVLCTPPTARLLRYRLHEVGALKDPDVALAGLCTLEFGQALELPALPSPDGAAGAPFSGRLALEFWPSGHSPPGAAGVTVADLDTGLAEVHMAHSNLGMPGITDGLQGVLQHLQERTDSGRLCVSRWIIDNYGNEDCMHRD